MVASTLSMTRLSGLAGFAASLLVLVGTRPARGEDVATAVVQFDRGLEEMLAGNHRVGCPALAESYRLDPLPGTLFTLAECEKRWERVATAVARYESYLAVEATLPPAARAAQTSRPSVARAAIAELQPRVPTLRVLVDEGWPAQTAVTKDGEVLGVASLGLALPLDPGEHVIEIRAPGVRTVSLRIAIGEREHRELRSGPPRAVPSDVGPAAAISPAPDEAPGGAQRAVSIGMGSLGVASLVVGLVSGGLALGDTSAIDRDCGDDRICDTVAGKETADAAKDKALVSTVALATGGALLTTAMVLYWTAPDGSPRSASASLGARPLAEGVLGVGALRW